MVGVCITPTGPTSSRDQRRLHCVAIQARFTFMPRRPFSEVVAAVFAAHPELAEEFYISASELLNDFDHWGPVIQANESGEYDDSTEIMKLRVAYEALSSKINTLALEKSD